MICGQVSLQILRASCCYACLWAGRLNDSPSVRFQEMTNFEHATKIPLMIGCPGGKCVGRTSALVESIDIMPTLLEEAGITAPACPSTHAGSRATTFCVEGRSLSPLLREPTTPSVLAKYSAAYSQFPRPEHPSTIDLSCRDDPKTQHGCALGPCLDGCPNKMGKSSRCPTCSCTSSCKYVR